ncbi:hypothetical protein RMATCC62417_08795 [Rhizopus microsporus]|nr:hypothetical protein RMATCC62417_08795 [Rhizopus microsporus]
MQKLLFSSEFLASGHSNEFREFITRIIQSKSKAEEKSHVQEELTKLAPKLSSPDTASFKMREYLIRLIHCFMLGYSVDFGVIYAIMATQSGENALDKRVGYLACTLFLEKDHELCIMMINTLQKDLKSQNELDQCAALNAICYLRHPEIADNVFDLVIKAATEVPKQAVRKKAIAALYFLYEAYGLSEEHIMPTLRQALNDPDQSVVFAALAVWKNILQTRAIEFVDLLPQFYTIHRYILDTKVHKSFAYHGVLAPWAQLDCLSIYESYARHEIGSDKDMFDIVMSCLKSVEKKVDAAFAIVLECTKLLGMMDPLSITAFSEEEEGIFDYLDPFLQSRNHNLRYLGLLGLSYLDSSLWKPDWLDGTLLGAIILEAADNDTIIQKALELLDRVMSLDTLKKISPSLLEALSRASNKSNLAYWFIGSLNNYHIDPDKWYIDTLMQVMRHAREQLDEDFVAIQCDTIKTVLNDEMTSISLKEAVADASSGLLRMAGSYSSSLIRLCFWVLGEYGYLSNKYTEIDRMKQIHRRMMKVEDDETHITGLIAVKQCMLRSQTWTSTLESLFKVYETSPVPEKAQLSRELLDWRKDDRFKKVVVEMEPLVYSTNPSRPSASVTRFPINKSDDEHIIKQYPQGLFQPSKQNSAIPKFVPNETTTQDVG